MARGLEESELAEHITKLHEYNEIKDIAQMILGHIGMNISLYMGINSEIELERKGEMWS